MDAAAQSSKGSDGSLRRQRFREELLAKEKEARLSEQDEAVIAVLNKEDKVDIAGLLTASEDTSKQIEDVKNKYDDADAIEERDSDGFDSSEDESESSDDEDDEAVLQAELEKIRSERSAALAKKEQENKEIEEIEERQHALQANPLMNESSYNLQKSNSAKIKRRWNDDVVFQNTAKDEPEQKKRFINDTVRSDFHKSFMKQYLK